VVVSVAASGFLELVADAGGCVAGEVTGVAIVCFPGTWGDQPAEGAKARAATKPIELPGVVLAALALVGLGVVLGSEAPLIGLRTGLTVFAARSARRDALGRARTRSGCIDRAESPG
jgi:chloride channel protein, CIC family